MRKALLIFISILFVAQFTKAQKRDMLLYAVNNNGKVVSTKDSADYFLYIMPKDSATNLYPIIEMYPNGKRKLVGTSQSDLYYALVFDGIVVSYYGNGHKQRIENYSEGRIKGDIINYYPNGKIYTIKKKVKGMDYLIECRDSTGTMQAVNGNGKWIIFDSDFKQKSQEGPVVDSLENGEWHETYGNTTKKYVTLYKNGQVVSSTDPHMVAFYQVFDAVEREPTCKNFGDFLARNIHYPSEDRRNGTQGKVFIQFIVEKDRTLSNFKVLRSTDQSLADEAIRVLKLSPAWIPGIQNGKPVRVRYTIPISFTLNKY